MRVIAKSSLKKFWDRPGCGDARGPLHSWYDGAIKATWASPQDVKDQYANVSICGSNRVVFTASAAFFAAQIAVRTELDRALRSASAVSVRWRRLAARWVLHHWLSRVSPRSRLNASRLPMTVRILGAAVRPERLSMGFRRFRATGGALSACFDP